MVPVTLLLFWCIFGRVFVVFFFFVFVCFFLGLGEKTVRRKQVCDWLAQSLFQSQCGCLSS